MPLYFFDRIENGELSRGEHGMEFAMLEDARRGAAARTGNSAVHPS